MPIIKVPTERMKQCLDNAIRLRDDAAFLASNRRHASAFYIAAIAAEEIGKYVVLAWNEYKPIDKLEKLLRLHEAKQDAFVSLIFIDILVKGTLAGSTYNVAENFEGNLSDALHTIKVDREFDESVNQAVDHAIDKEIAKDPHMYLTAMSIFGIFQDRKHDAIYSDAVGNRQPETIREKEVTRLIEAVERSLKLLGDNDVYIVNAQVVSNAIKTQAMQDAIRNTRENLRDDKNWEDIYD